MKKNTVIVTGGGKGIGKAIAIKLHEAGFSVHLCGKTESPLKEVATALGVTYSVVDLANREAVKQFCSSWDQSIYGIINNAGICKTGLLIEEKDVWDEVIDTNLSGMYFFTKGLIRYIENQGRIINISSQLGKEGRAGYGAYCASKFATIGLTKCWAKELGERGVTVNAICPGWVKTDMAINDLERLAKEKDISAEELYQEICAPLELKRFTEPSEVAALVCFLLSSEGSGITGRDWLMNTIWNQE